ncbi:hypothetical protein [Microbacterium elymi]|uniref:Uncharacterized protein n=1 Tax=Microbacterium elymi TaxID=2909587 RepID=A0ABY5NGJ1_9MICO|nr:hypothetical protein [Microbacterium elymi]UUT34268.1 hypothetical protein L2X98_26670 [Microbacterium elymi]
MPGAGRCRRSEQSAWAAAQSADEADEIADDLRTLAETYEIVELRARQAMAVGAGARAGAALVSGRAEVQHPAAADAADRATSAWERRVGGGLISGANLGWALPTGLGPVLPAPVAAALYSAVIALPAAAQNLQALAGCLGTGVIGPDERLDGAARPVRLERTSAVTATGPPDDFAAALGRIPSGDARIRVETYTMPDGTTRYAVYLAGTRDFSPTTEGADPWDMRSNLRLYLGRMPRPTRRPCRR